MVVYRIGYKVYATDPLNGEGPFLFGGRWSSVGTRMAYTSTTLSLAMAEFLAHVDATDFDPDTPPALVYLRATVPDRSVRTLADIGADLPDEWGQTPAPDHDATIGDEWIRSAASVALVVPSVHVPIATPERNVLINPRHADFSSVIAALDNFTFDRRLLRARAQAEGTARREPRRGRKA
jgi:RES domain-containing protein